MGGVGYVMDCVLGEYPELILLSYFLLACASYFLLFLTL
jgi:hypothetical protein